MRFPDDVAQRAAAYYRRHLPQLLACDSYEWSLPLQAPSATAASDNFNQVEAFTRTWQAWTGPGEISFECKHWHRAGLGIQNIPTRISTTSSSQLAELAGFPQEFSELHNKLALLSPENKEKALEVLSLWRHLPLEECPWVPQVVDWFRNNPNSGLRPRAVAVAGVHGKWLERNERLVRHLLGTSDLGLETGDSVVRIRVLDPLLRSGLTDFSTPVEEAATLWRDSAPRTAVIVENKETFLGLTSEWNKTVAIWGSGYAVGLLDQLPWLHRCQRIIYWGDLDADGFAILNRLRSKFTDVESILMSPADVERWGHLGVPDPGDFSKVLPLLTQSESNARQALVTLGAIRIEQERIPWDVAVSTLTRAIQGEADGA